MSTKSEAIGANPLIDEPSSDMSLADICRSLVRQKRWVIGITGAAIISAAAYLFLVPSEWEATAIIQIGQVGREQDDSAPSLIEPPARAMERMKLVTFEDDVLSSLNIPGAEDNPTAKLYRKSLRLKLLPNTDLIEIKVRGYSREEAGRWAAGTVERLSKIHDELAVPIKERLSRSLTELKRNIRRLEGERALLARNLSPKQRGGAGNQFVTTAFLGNILSEKEEQIEKLRTKQEALEEQLTPVKTNHTSLLDKVHVPETRVFPKRSAILAVAGMAGLVLGIFMALIVDALRKSRSSSSPRPAGLSVPLQRVDSKYS